MTQLYTTKLVILSLVATSALQAQSVYTAGHGDIGLAYEDGAFEPHWHLGSGAVVDDVALVSEGEYEPDQIVAATVATRYTPSGLSAALGVADGTEIFVLGSATYLPNLGFAVEELDYDDWVDGSITLSLTNWSIPTDGDLALYTTNLVGSSVADVAFSTYSVGATAFGNELELTAGDHVHFQWGLTTVGDYDLEFTWEGVHVDDGYQTSSGVFTVSAVPEPASTGLIMVSVVGLMALVRRRQFA